MAEISAVAITIAKPGCEDKLSQALQELLAPTRKEAGVMQYEMHRDVQEPRCFVFVERWQSEETFEAHCNSPHVNAYLAKAADWIDGGKLHVLKKIA